MQIDDRGQSNEGGNVSKTPRTDTYPTKLVERSIEEALHPKGMATHDGFVKLRFDYVQRILAVSRQLETELQAAEAALARARTGAYIACANCLLESQKCKPLMDAEQRIEELLEARSSVGVPVHTDHPLRHWDRTCPACIAEEASRPAQGEGK